jgi:putative ABC transport system ATP-binding protein
MTGALPPVVRLRGATLDYPGPPPFRALHEVDLDVEAGDHLAIVGPSGSGKSTMLNVLGLLDRPTDGRYDLDGIDTGALSDTQRTALRASRIGFVFQAFHLMAHRSALENVALPLLYRGMRSRQARAAAATALESVGLQDRQHASPATLSGGERQRTAIARALVGQPRLLLCDEPTGNLDSDNADGVLRLLDDLNATGVTIVVITHGIEVSRRARRVVELKDGTVRAGRGASA